MEWILVGLLGWWIGVRLQDRARLRQQQALQRQLLEQPGAPWQQGPWVMPGFLMAISGDYAYWQSGGRLMRAPWRDGMANPDEAEPADPHTCPDLSSSEVAEILDALRAARSNMSS